MSSIELVIDDHLHNFFKTEDNIQKIAKILEYSYYQKLMILMTNESKILADPLIGPRLRMQGITQSYCLLDCDKYWMAKRMKQIINV